MSRFAKLAALVAILGMVGISAGAAVVLSRSCCSADCEKCPVFFCKDSNVDLAKKIVTPGIASTVVVVAVPWSVRVLAPAAVRPLDGLRSGFVCPMRN